MKLLRYYDDAFQAHADREFLLSEGIPAEVLNENLSGMLPYSIPSLRPYIAVPDSYYEEALGKITPPDSPVTGCPECGSGDIKFRLPDKYRGMTRWVIGILAFFGGPFGNLRRINHCNSCGHEFRP